MPKQYTQEQLDRAYEKLPEELQEAMFSMETANAIWNACEQQGIGDKRISTIAKYVGDVLLGLFPPSEFQEILEKEIKLPPQVAKEIAREINRFVFYPVKPALEQLHSMEMGAKANPVRSQTSNGAKEKEGEEAAPAGAMGEPGEQPEEQEPEQKEGPSEEDKYREQLE